MLANVRTTEEATSLEFKLRRIATSLLAGLGAIGLLLSLVGLFGVLAWTVSRSTPEIGIRMALGASRGAVRARVVKTGLMLVGIGSIVGIAIAMLVTWPLRSFVLAGANRRRSPHAREHLRRAAADGRRRQLHPRASRQPHRSRDGAAPRLTSDRSRQHVDPDVSDAIGI